MFGGSPERDSRPPGPPAASEEASTTVASSNIGSNPEPSPQEQPSGTYASGQQPTHIESCEPIPAPPDTSTPVSTDASKNQPQLAPLPSRTSSPEDQPSTLENSHETTNHSSDPPLRQKRSLLNRRRDKSRGSSSRSRRNHQDAPIMETAKAATGPDMHRPSPSEKKSKRPSKIFAILTCCASSSEDSEDTVPPKKTVRQTGPSTQPTPEKIDVNTGDSSTVEPKESNHVEDEKTNLAVTSDQPQSSEEERNLGRLEDDSQVDGTASAALKNEAAGSQALDGLQDTPEATVPPEKSDGTPHKIEPIETTTAAQVKEGPADRAEPTEKLLLAGDRDKGDSQYPIDEEDAIKSPTGLPPPPLLAPKESQEPLAPNERPPMLLPPAEPHLQGRKCLVLDLDETLVHSSFKVLERADFTIPVEIEGQYHNIYVIKRPGVDQFMKRVGELYEVVVFTASVAKYGDPLLDQLDIHKAVHHRLFRDSCFNHQGNYVKDLSQVGRNLRETIIIDNSPTSYIFHPQHAIPISSWFSDAHDNELLDLIPVLEDLASTQVRDVSLVLDISC